ncbi:hypothetical protein ACHHYP_11431 [Achlya hypogyna]|uniref:Uncharacterized protein n=1 Tax=Achlya hypogyna TaxID=1202772 RepID=A0A1V9YJ61_ACHHY|nr:hypothetical protein ACHHYP_11431 [Achlya hypogyna]
MEFVKKARGRTMTEGEKLDILCAQAVMHHAGEKDVRARLATLFKRSPKVIDHVWSSFVNDQVVPPAAASSNRTPSSTRIPRTRAIATKVQEFVRIRRQRRERTVAKDVLAMLEDDNVVAVDHSTRATYNSALRAVQRLLRYLGYKRGKRKNKGLGLAPRLRVERDSDLQPIETIWAIVKGQVGRAYTSDTTLNKVRERLEEAFADLQIKTVHESIAKAAAHLKTLLDYITATDNSSSVEEYGEEGGSCESDPDSGTDSMDSGDAM